MSGNTFDGKIVIEYFRDNLKKYLKSTDNNVISENEMLQAIENTLKSFNEEHGLNSDNVSNISKVLLDGYAMTSVYRFKNGTPKNCLHSRNMYTEQSQLFDEEKLAKLGIKQIQGDKVSKLIFDNLKSNKSENLKLLQLLSPNGVVLKPMILAKPSERDNIKFEDLPRLQKNTFYENFDKDCLSKNQVKSFKVIEAGIEGFVKEQPFTLPPEIEHPLLISLKRMKQCTSPDTLPIGGNHDDAMLGYIIGFLEGINNESDRYFSSDSEESFWGEEEEEEVEEEKEEEESEEKDRGVKRMKKMDTVRLRRDSFDYDSDSDINIDVE